MDPAIAFQQQQVMGDVKYLPAVSIILPFQPVITKKNKIEYSLMLIMKKIEQELLANYPAENAVPVILKLQNVVRNLNYITHKKSIAIFVSPVIEKVYYLDIEVRQKIVVDDSFEMRDILLSKKQTPQYLVMLLNTDSSKMYEGNCSVLNLIKSNLSNKTGLHGFIKEMDHGLAIILKSYSLPVFIMGTKNELDLFKKITANKKDIIQHIELSNELKDLAEMRKIILPYELNWKNLKEIYLLNRIKKAREADKLVVGIDNVWNNALRNNGKLLIIETKYLAPKMQTKKQSRGNKDHLRGNPFYIKDEVVEFVDEELLHEYGQIVLIEN
jgi:hypothetical protein